MGFAPIFMFKSLHIEKCFAKFIGSFQSPLTNNELVYTFGNNDRPISFDRTNIIYMKKQWNLSNEYKIKYNLDLLH